MIEIFITMSWAHFIPKKATKIVPGLMIWDLELTKSLFVHSVFFLIKNIARICTLVKVFLLPVVPHPKLYCVTTHLIDRMRVKSLSSPGICCRRPAAFFIPPANCFHTRILANICHLPLHQWFSVRHWNLAFWFNFKIIDKKEIRMEAKRKLVERISWS